MKAKRVLPVWFSATIQAIESSKQIIAPRSFSAVSDHGTNK